jgi:hypothetical protein
MKWEYFVKLILLFCLLLFGSTVAQQNKTKQNILINKTYKYQLQYPAYFIVEDKFDDEIYLDYQKTHLIIRVLEIETLFAEYSLINKNFDANDDKFVMVSQFHSIMVSGTDGLDGSVYLGDTYLTDDFISANNLRTIKFHADLVKEDYNSKTTKVNHAGPFYGIKLNSKYSLYITYNYGLELADNETEKMLDSIVKSVVLTK